MLAVISATPPRHLSSMSPISSPPPLVLVFAANPSSTSSLDLEGELRSIRSELEASGCAERLRVVDRRGTTPAAVQRTMLVEHPTVVQFSGHGRESSRAPVGARTPRDLAGIVLHDENDDDEVKLMSGAALGHLFAAAGSSVRLVVLNACHSHQQADALLGHVDFVVGVSGSITDAAARVFSTALYRALALGRSIRDAFELGRNALMLEGLRADVELPVLRARPGADPSATTLVDAPAADDGTSWDVYVAYAKCDRELVNHLAAELDRRHLRVFFDEKEMTPGASKVGRREDGIYGSTHGLMAVSARTMEERWVKEQYYALLEKAVEEDKLLIPVLLGEGDANVPPFLRTRHPVDLRGASDDDVRRGLEAITRAVRGQRPGPPSRAR